MQAQADVSAAPDAELSHQVAAAEAALQQAAAQAVEQQQEEAIPEAQGLFSEVDQAAGEDPVHKADKGPIVDAVAEVSQPYQLGSVYTSLDQQRDHVPGIAALEPVLSARMGCSLCTLWHVASILLSLTLYSPLQLLKCCPAHN